MTTAALLPRLAGSLLAPAPSQPEFRAGSVIAWSGDTDALHRLAWRHAWLTLMTLGLYRFWAKTAWRRAVWSSIRLDGRPLTYTGTVRELLMPVIAIGLGLAGVFVGLLIAKYFAVPRPKVTPSPWRLVVTLPLIFVIGLGVWRARSYLVTRTSIGGTPGLLHGNRFAYAGCHFATALAMPLTLGWALPFRQVLLQRRLIEGMQLDGRRFTFHASAAALLKAYALAWGGGIAIYLAAVLALAVTPLGLTIAIAARNRIWPHLSGTDIATIAIIAGAAFMAIVCLAAWYRIGLWRHFAASTRLDGRTFHLDATAGAYVALVAGNALIKAGSLFVLAPVADLRHTQFIMSRLSLR